MSSSVRYHHYLPFLTGMFVAVVLVSGIVSTKIINVWGLHLDGGTLLFPLSYIFGDILTEVYGYKRSRIVIWTGLVAMVIMSVMIILIGVMPVGGEWPHQESYNNVLMLAPRIFLASIIAYTVGEFVNSYIIAKLKIHTRGKHLWLRLIGSTVVGQLIDTILFVVIAFAGLIGQGELFMIALSTYIFKIVLEVILFPFTKYVITRLKTTEKVDHFDHDTDFNPFVLD
ncbi:Inner membrane protein YhhQ [candidate division SR1 bacterium Aalborg_AAW-1]|nr:Inner membrane protein YhhQ [candidate division SR1 bacterium Aalborg_AAW-1]